MIARVSLYAKALAAALGGCATVMVSSFPDSDDAQLVAGLLGVLATVALVFATPNATPSVPADVGDAGRISADGVFTIAFGIVVAAVFLALLAYLF